MATRIRDTSRDPCLETESSRTEATKQTSNVSRATKVCHGKASQKRSAFTKGIPGSEHSGQQSEITKIKQVLKLVISENTALKDELAVL